MARPEILGRAISPACKIFIGRREIPLASWQKDSLNIIHWARILQQYPYLPFNSKYLSIKIFSNMQ